MVIHFSIDKYDDVLESIKVDDIRFSKAVAQFKIGYRAKAIKEFEALIKEGVPNVIGALAYQNMARFAMEKLFPTLVKWSKMPNLEPMDRVALAILFNNHIAHDDEMYYNMSKELIQDLVDMGNEMALCIRAYLSINLSEPFEESLKWCKIGVDKGIAECAYLMGYTYLSRMTDSNRVEYRRKGAEWYRKAESMGYELAILDLLSITDEDDMKIKDGTSPFMERVKCKGSIGAMEFVASNLANDDSPYYDPITAIDYYDRVIIASKEAIKDAKMDEDAYYAEQTLKHAELEMNTLKENIVRHRG